MEIKRVSGIQFGSMRFCLTFTFYVLIQGACLHGQALSYSTGARRSILLLLSLLLLFDSRLL